MSAKEKVIEETAWSLLGRYLPVSDGKANPMLSLVEEYAKEDEKEDEKKIPIILLKLHSPPKEQKRIIDGIKSGQNTDFHLYDFSWINLARANLQEANLANARLIQTDLKCACLQKANLEGAYLQRADLRKAHLEGANLQGAHLKGANLSGTYLQTANLQRAYLKEADLSEACLEGTNLHGANLEKANLMEALLKGAYLGEAKLGGATLSLHPLLDMLFDENNGLSNAFKAALNTIVHSLILEMKQAYRQSFKEENGKFGTFWARSGALNVSHKFLTLNSIQEIKNYAQKNPGRASKTLSRAGHKTITISSEMARLNFPPESPSPAPR